MRVKCRCMVSYQLVASTVLVRAPGWSCNPPMKLRDVEMGGGGEFLGCCYKPRSMDLAISDRITVEENSLRLMLGHGVKYCIYYLQHYK